MEGWPQGNYSLLATRQSDGAPSSHWDIDEGLFRRWPLRYRDVSRR